MWKYVFGFLIILAFAGCAVVRGVPEVHFEWFNLGTNEIWVTDVVGLPAEASPGRLTVNRAESQLETSESIFSETVRVKDRITIKWRDNGKEGWPGGLKIPGSVPPGTAHQVEFNRGDLGIPAKMRSGKVRFTYLGEDKWRIKVIE